MAIRIDASGDYVRRTAALPSDTLFTIMGWCYLVSDRTGNYRYFAGIEDATSNASNYRLIGWNNANGFQISAHTASSDFAASPSNGQWFYFALVSNGTGAGSLIGYYITTAGTVYTATAANVTAMTEAALFLGNDSYDEWNGLRLANILVYDAALTQAEITAQMWRFWPVRRTNIHAHWPMFGGATERLRDYSGNGKTLTAGGTLTDEAGPPVGLGMFSSSFVPTSAASGAQTLTLTHLTNTATVHSLTITTGAVAVAPNHLTNTSVIHSPTVTPGAVTVAPAHLTNSLTVYSPTVTTGAVTIAPTHLSNTPVIHAPTVSPGAVTVAPDHVASETAVHSPTLTTGVTIAPDHLTNTSTVHSPTIAAGAVTVAPNHLTNSSVVHSPAVAVGAVTVAPDHLINTTTVYGPTVVASGAIAPDHLVNVSVIHEPIISTGAVTIAPDHLTNTSTVYAPVVTPAAITIAPEPIASGAAVYPPVVSTGAVGIAPNHLVNTSIVYSPFVGTGEAQIIAPNHLLNTSQFWALVLLSVPSNRIYRIAAEARVYQVSAESRVYSIGAESRVLTIEGD